jgi:hypothetical protein
MSNDMTRSDMRIGTGDGARCGKCKEFWNPRKLPDGHITGKCLYRGHMVYNFEYCDTFRKTKDNGGG